MMILYLRIRASRTIFPCMRRAIKMRKLITDKVSHRRRESSPLSKSCRILGIWVIWSRILMIRITVRMKESKTTRSEGNLLPYNSYHPCHVGEILVNRYVLIQKLGWGHFSTVWLAKDFKYGNYAAVKIMKSSPHYLEASYDEVIVLVSKTGLNPTKSRQQRLSSWLDQIAQGLRTQQGEVRSRWLPCAQPPQLLPL